MEIKLITHASCSLEELVNHLVNFIFYLYTNLFNPAFYTAKMIIITSHAALNLACVICHK